jgi:hypothetical protein
MIQTARSAAFTVLLWGIAALTFAAQTAAVSADSGFPFNQDLLLDAAPMRPAKRVPIINVAPDGRATIDLWCKTVPGHVAVEGGAIRIDTPPLPEALPPYMAVGQCTPERMQADYDMLTALVQATSWQRRGNTVMLSGIAPLRFRVSDH